MTEEDCTLFLSRQEINLIISVPIQEQLESDIIGPLFSDLKLRRYLLIMNLEINQEL